MNDIHFIFFGGEPLGVPALDALEGAGLLPQLIVCNPDRPQGRKMILTPPPVKVWAGERNIAVFQPERFDDAAHQRLADTSADLFVVVAYNAIIPKHILEIPEHGVLNAHPSLLPRFRGPSPIRSAILADERVLGSTIILLDEQMDHGPIVAQETLAIDEHEWPLPGRQLDERLAEQCGTLLARSIPKWIAGEIEPQEQEHESATYTHKLTKADAEIDLSDDPYTNLLKIRAYDGWPGAFFYTDRHGKTIRVKVTDAELDTNGALRITRVVPEGKSEMAYDDFLRSE